MIIASNNKNKIVQFRDILPNFNLVGMRDANINIDVEENGKTFEENSYIKARAIHNISHDSVVSDDSGLCIDIYDGWPGVETHRFLGDDASSTDRNNYILDKMKNLDGIDRSCTSVCVITLIDKGGKAYSFRGETKGKISREIRGLNSFGYDDIFELSDGRTMAELTNAEKYNYNARARALNKLKEFVESNKDVEL